MKIAMIGTGYVGLVSGTCFAESGNDVIGIDKDQRKIDMLEAGQMPIYEPGLLELVKRNRKEGRLNFTTDLANGIKDARLIFVAVGTPQGPDGAADLSSMWAVADEIAATATGPKIVVIKSTVPVGTNATFLERVRARTKEAIVLASNPEFLKEGAAVDDFMRPDRVVVGVREPDTAKVLHELYAPFLRTERPFLAMSPESAEMTKYVANAMLATKISFINEMSNLCERAGADINDVRRGIGHDVRIGFQFLFPGVGYGGSCFEGDETVFVLNSPNVAAMPLRDIFDAGGKPFQGDMVEGVVPSGCRVLAFDLETGQPALAEVQAVTRRPYHGLMAHLKTSMGRSLRVTADHPVILHTEVGREVKLAGAVKPGDRLLALCELPAVQPAGSLNLIELLHGTDLESDVHVCPIDDSFAAQYRHFVRHVPKEILRHPNEIRRQNRMPLRLFNLLRDQGLIDVAPEKLQLYTAKGNATKINVMLPLDADLLRLCGYYIAEGYISQDTGRAGAVRDRVGFSFHENEAEYITDVRRILRRWGLKYLERRSPGALTTIVSSRVFAWLLRDVLKCGTHSENKALPRLAFNVPPDMRQELLRGAFSGDGAVTVVQTGKNFMLEYATVSKALADGLTLLLQSVGVVPSLRRRWMNKSTHLAYILRVSGHGQLTQLRQVFGEKHRARIDTLLDGYQRHIRQHGFLREGACATLQVRSVDLEEADTTVYSLETSMGTVIGAAGLVLHNCFPKDVRALIATAKIHDVPFHLMEAVDHVNEAQKKVLFRKIRQHYGSSLPEITITLWGLAFKPRTDDIREAPALVLIDSLLAEGVKVRVHDPEAMGRVREIYGDKVTYCDRPYGALEGSDGLAVITEWQEFRNPDFMVMRRLMRQPVIFDGRNVYELNSMAEHGFTYYGMGRELMKRDE